MSSTQLYTRDPARLTTARGSAPPSPTARTPATCAAMGTGGERQPGIGHLCQYRCACAAHRSRVRNRIEFERLATSSGARQSAPASAVRVAQVSSREPAGAINWHATSCVHQCKRAQCARAASTPVGRRGAYRAAKHTSRPDGKHAAQPQGHACARRRLGAGGSGMRRLKIRGISGRATARGLSVRPLAALGYHTATFGPLPGAPEGRRTQT